MSRSSTEAEYRSMVMIMCELTWLRYLLQDLHVHHHELAKLFCDNQATIYIVKNQIYYERTNTLSWIVTQFVSEFKMVKLKQPMCKPKNKLQTYSQHHWDK